MSYKPELAERIGSRLALETLYSREGAYAVADRWTALAAEYDWSDEETERLAMACAANFYLHPDDFARVLVPRPLAYWSRP